MFTKFSRKTTKKISKKQAKLAKNWMVSYLHSKIFTNHSRMSWPHSNTQEKNPKMPIIFLQIPIKRYYLSNEWCNGSKCTNSQNWEKFWTNQKGL